MVIGGYISAAGLGLTCPDWPLCPNGILPDDEYFIEWSHRLIAATTGVLVMPLPWGLGLQRALIGRLELLQHWQQYLL